MLTPSIQIEIEITGAHMRSDHELEIRTRRQFGGSEYHVAVQATINGTKITGPSTEKDLGTNLSATSDPDAFVIDLEQQGVARFTTNQKFPLTVSVTAADGSQVSDTKKGVILLPTVIVPGIQPRGGHPNGGAGTYWQLENYLTQRSAALLGSGTLGDGYRLVGAAPYPTLYTLTYDTNHASLTRGANQLAQLIRSLTDPAARTTYASAVNLVTQSKGGLVGRRFIVRPGNAPRVNRMIMCAPPNLGSVWAALDAEPFADYSNLQPLWPWDRRLPAQRFISTPNFELFQLNQVPLPALPSGNPYTIIYSDSTPTPYTFTSAPWRTWATRALAVGSIGGDLVVPAFSARGELLDPNHPVPAGPLPRIRAFQGIPIQYVPLPGTHSFYLNQQPVQDAIFTRLWDGL